MKAQQTVRRDRCRSVANKRLVLLRSRALRLEPLEDRCLLSVVSSPAWQSATAGVEYLGNVMDEYHDCIWLYEDIGSAGNHFFGRGVIADDLGAVSMDGSYAEEKYSGATSIRCEFDNTTGVNWGGYYFMNGILGPEDTAPQLNWGTIPNAGMDLSGVTALTFWAKGEQGGEEVEFFVGGVGRDASTGEPVEPYPDSLPRYPARGSTTVLQSQWTPYTIPLGGRDLSYVLGAFGWVANAPNNPNGAVFYLDEMKFELDPQHQQQRLDEPRFLRSYETRDVQPDLLDDNPNDDIDLVLRNAASTYDNSLALLAFLVEGSDGSLRRAKLIGDALVYAGQHDRYYDDGRMRSFYMAGDIRLPPGWTPNGRAATVPVPGYYVEFPGTFYEVGQESISVGDNAWAMVALLALQRRTGEQVYLPRTKIPLDFRG